MLKSRLNLTYFMCKKDDLILTHFWCKGSMSSLQAARGISAPKPWKGITEMIPYSLYSGWHKHTRHRVIPTTVRFMQRAARSSFISITFFQMTTWTNRIKVTVLANKIIIIKQPKYILKSQTFTIVKLVYLLKKKRLIKSESIAKSKPAVKYKVAVSRPCCTLKLWIILPHNSSENVLDCASHTVRHDKARHHSIG